MPYDYNGEEYLYKLVWCENNDGKWGTAFGNAYTITGSVVIFHGSFGDIILPPSLVYVIK